MESDGKVCHHTLTSSNCYI